MTTAVNSSQMFHLDLLQQKANDLWTFCDKFSTVLSRNAEFNDGLGPNRSQHLWDSIKAVEYTLPRLANAADVRKSDTDDSDV